MKHEKFYTHDHCRIEFIRLLLFILILFIYWSGLPIILSAYFKISAVVFIRSIFTFYTISTISVNVAFFPNARINWTELHAVFEISLRSVK